MQSSLRAIVLALGVLLLVAALTTFGRDGFLISRAMGPAVMGLLGALLIAFGWSMAKGGLWRRIVADEHADPANDDLHRATFLQDDRSASTSSHDAD